MHTLHLEYIRLFILYLFVVFGFFSSSSSCSSSTQTQKHNHVHLKKWVFFRCRLLSFVFRKPLKILFAKLFSSFLFFWIIARVSTISHHCEHTNTSQFYIRKMITTCKLYPMHFSFEGEGIESCNFV